MAFLDISEFWKIIKRTRKTILGSGNIKCDRYSGVTTNIVATRAITSNMKALIANVGINVTYQIYQNVTSEILSTAGEMFIYLNFCPELLTWREFLDDLLENHTPHMILMTLNKITKVGIKKEISTKIATPLLRKLTEMFDLQYMHFGIGLVNNLSVYRQGNYIIQCQYWNE